MLVQRALRCVATRAAAVVSGLLSVAKLSPPRQGLRSLRYQIVRVTVTPQPSRMLGRADDAGAPGGTGSPVSDEGDRSSAA